jgi:hypothetical protein
MEKDSSELRFFVEFDGEVAMVRTITESDDLHVNIVEEVLPGGAFYTISYEQLLTAGEGHFKLVNGELTKYR